MIITNEIQTDVHYTTDIPEEYILTLVNLGVIEHVQTTVTDYSVHRYFVKPEDAHEFVLNDHRTDSSVSEGLTDQIVMGNLV